MLIVHCVLCIDGDGSEVVHVFSTRKRAEAFANDDPRDHVLYDYLVDRPERMEEVCTLQ